MKKTITTAIAALAAGGILLAGAGAAAALDTLATGDGETQAECDARADHLNRLKALEISANQSGNAALADSAGRAYDTMYGRALAAGCAILEGKLDDGQIRPEFDGATTATDETAPTSPRNGKVPERYTPIGGGVMKSF